MVTYLGFVVLGVILFLFSKRTDEKTWKRILDIFAILSVIIGIITFTNSPENPWKDSETSLQDYFGQIWGNIQDIFLNEEHQIATPTSIPLTNLVYRDDYSSESSDWDNYSTANVLTGYENGKYRIELKEHKVLFLSIWEILKDFDNGVLMVDVLGPFKDHGASAQGIGFGWHKDWAGYSYAFTIRPDGSCQFYEYDNGSYYEKETSRIPKFDSGKAYHQVRVDIRNGEASGFIDGEFCTSYTMTHYQPGSVGVVGSAPNGTRKMFFDEFRIFVLP